MDPLTALLERVDKAVNPLACTLGSWLPSSLAGKLSPEYEVDEEIVEEGSNDLLSLSQCRTANEKGRRDVVLALETFTAMQSKVVNATTLVALLIGYSVLVPLVVLKYWLSDRSFYEDHAYNAASICVAGICLLALLVRGGIFAGRICSNLKQGNRWPRRRLRVMLLAFIALLVQIVNLISWIAPNAYLAYVPCRWNGWNERVVDAFGAIRWTCWNTHFVLFLISAHNLCAWTSPTARSSAQQALPLVLDAPWTIHLWKALAWVAFEAVLLSWVALGPTGSMGSGPRGCESQPVIPQQVPSCKNLGHMWGSFGIAGMTLAYFMAYIGYYVVGYYQLMARSQRSARTATILFRLQKRSTFLAHQAISFSNSLMWYSQQDNCWSRAMVWWGIPSMQIVATILIWQNCWYFMPSAADEDPILQVYLQEFAWSEEQRPGAVAARANHAVHAAERSLLTTAPMFCFQTAVALHRWSCLAYMDVEGVKLPGSQEAAEEAAEGQLAAQDSDEGLPTRTSEGLCKGAVGLRTTSGSAAGPKLQSAPSFVGFTAEGMNSQLTGHERRDSSSAASTSCPASEPDSGTTDDTAMGTGKPKRRAGRRRQAAKRSPDAVQAALDAAMSLYGLSSFKLFWDPALHTKALLAWNSDTAVLAFRGTASLTNAWSDLQVWMRAHPPQQKASFLGSSPKVHSGFYKAWTANHLHTEIMAFLQDLVDSGQLSQQARLLITGHSLGGALAVLAAFDIKRAMGSFRVELYTYGTPYPGNRAFARQFNALLPDTWHVIHDGDAVTRTGKFFVGKRPGQRVIVDQLGDMRVRPNPLELQLQRFRQVNPHYLESYRTGLQAAMLLQFSRRGTPRGRAGVLALGQNTALRAVLAAEGVDWEQLQEAHMQGKALQPSKKGAQLAAGTESKAR